MENINRSVTGMFLAAAIVVIGGAFFLPGAVKTVKNADFDLSYSMPRPKNVLYNFFFGLDGREIDRKEINPFKDKKAAAADATAQNKNLPKIDPKKAAAAKAAQKAVAANPSAAKKPEVKVNVVNSAPESTLNAGATDSNAPVQGSVMGAQNPVAGQAGAQNQKEDTLSAAQWRALVVGQPTKENVMKLVTAFNNKEVDVSTLYLIMNDLLQSSNAETQGHGLLIAQSIPSLKSFTLVSENYDRLDTNTKKKADSYLMTYMHSSKLSILAMALQSEDSQVVARAAQVMVAGLEQVKNGQGSTKSDSRYDSGRGIVASSPGRVYAPFVTIFQDLLKSSDNTVAGLAQNALTQIQSLSNT